MPFIQINQTKLNQNFEYDIDIQLKEFYIYNRAICLMSTIFAKGLGDRGSISG